MSKTVIEWLKKNKTVVSWVAVGVIFFALLILVSLTSAIVVCLFMAALILGLDNALPLGAAVVFLLISAILVAAGQNNWAKSIADWAFYFLAIGVIMQVIKYMRSTKESEPADE